MAEAGNSNGCVNPTDFMLEPINRSQEGVVVIFFTRDKVTKETEETDLGYCFRRTELINLFSSRDSSVIDWETKTGWYYNIPHIGWINNDSAKKLFCTDLRMFKVTNPTPIKLGTSFGVSRMHGGEAYTVYTLVPIDLDFREIQEFAQSLDCEEIIRSINPDNPEEQERYIEEVKEHIDEERMTNSIQTADTEYVLLFLKNRIEDNNALAPFLKLLVSNANPVTIKAILDKYPALASEITFFAVTYGRIETLDILQNLRTDLVVDAERDLLYEALFYGQIETAKYLLSKGWRIRNLDNLLVASARHSVKTMEYALLLGATAQNSEKALKMAIQSDNEETATFFLNRKVELKSALIYAIEYPVIVRLLLSRGYSPNEPGLIKEIFTLDEYYHPLGGIETLELLFNYGLNVENAVSEVDSFVNENNTYQMEMLGYLYARVGQSLKEIKMCYNRRDINILHDPTVKVIYMRNNNGEIQSEPTEPYTEGECHTKEELIKWFLRKRAIIDSFGIYYYQLPDRRWITEQSLIMLMCAHSTKFFQITPFEQVVIPSFGGFVRIYLLTPSDNRGVIKKVWVSPLCKENIQKYRNLKSLGEDEKEEKDESKVSEKILTDLIASENIEEINAILGDEILVDEILQQRVINKAIELDAWPVIQYLFTKDRELAENLTRTLHEKDRSDIIDNLLHFLQ